MKNFWRIAGFLSLLFGGQFTLTAMAQSQLGRVVQGNLDFIELNHLRGDINNLQARMHQIVYHNRYGYGYHDGGGFFYGTDQYGRGSRGRVRLNPVGTTISGALIGGGIGGGKGALIGGGAGLATSVVFNAIANHREGKKAKKEAEFVAIQQQAEYEASLEKKLVRNRFQKGSVRVYNGADMIVQLNPGVSAHILVPAGTEIWAEGVWENPRTGQEDTDILQYGRGKRKLPQGAGWEFFDPALEALKY